MIFTANASTAFRLVGEAYPFDAARRLVLFCDNHNSMRVHHVEQVMRGPCAIEPPPSAPPDQAQIDVERLRHLLWNGHHETAREALARIASWAKDAVVPNGPAAKAKFRRLAAHCAELRSYIENNEGALIDYGQRCRAGKPIPTSRAEGTVNNLVNARTNKRRQMCWSPGSAHRVLQVRAAVLDERLGQQTIQLAAWRPRYLALSIQSSNMSDDFAFSSGGQIDVQFSYHALGIQ